MTAGLVRISAGVPSAILRPKSSTAMRSRDVHDEPHVVLDEQDRVAAVADRAG